MLLWKRLKGIEPSYSTWKSAIACQTREALVQNTEPFGLRLHYWYAPGYLWAALHSHIMSNLFMRSDGVLEQGIAYYARHDDEALCYAIFDRARSAIKEVKREINLDKSWFWKLAQRYKVGMAPRQD